MKSVRVAGIILVAFLLLGNPANGTMGLPPLDQVNVQGDWVAFDARSGDVFRLRIVGRVATLAVTAGAKQPEFAFRSHDFALDKGRFSAALSEKTGGPLIRIDGEGRANAHGGFMTVKISGREGRYVELCREQVEFAKESPGLSIAELLLRNDKRARSLLDSIEKGHPQDDAREPVNRGH